ncbi:transketolase family protein [Rhodobacteraceae bacterium IMCC15231]|nr:transketolase family protein [Rhodobacteraceae bacterium IMCC15231]
MDREPILIASSGDSLRESFGKELVKLGSSNKNLVVLDADIAGGTGVHHFRSHYPERFIQCGIAEQNMIAMAGGLAAMGFIPIVTTFAIFMLRALEQARLSLAYADMNVKLVASHPGLDVGPDGASAQCLEDLACFRSIPNMTVLSPCDPIEMAQATKAIVDYKGPVYMRTGRSDTREILDPSYEFQIGKAKIIREGFDATIVACGVEVARALDASHRLEQYGLKIQVVNMSTIKPIDESTLIEVAMTTGAIVTAEDHNILGGLGGAVAEVLSRTHPTPIEFVGTKDTFGESGEPDQLAEKYEISTNSIEQAVLKVIGRKRSI